MTDFGAWTLLPPALAIATAMITRRVYQSLLLGVFAAGIMYAGDRSFGEMGGIAAFFASIAGGFIQSVKWIIGGIADTDHAEIILFTVMLGALVALMQRSGAIRGFGEAAMRYAHNRRIGQGLAWGLGAAFLAIDDYFHVIAAGTVFRPVTDKLKVSREKLAYIIDSTAAPMVILVPISTWAGFILGLVGDELIIHGVERTAFSVFLEGIPFNFYAIATVLFVGLIAFTSMEFGPMRRAEKRAMRGEGLMRDGAKPLMSKELALMEPAPGATPRAFNLVLPILFLFGAVITILYVTGYDPNVAAQDSFTGAIQHADAELSLAIASFLTVVFAMVLYSWQGLMNQDEFLDTSLEGFKAMLPAIVILGLAWAIGDAVAPVEDGGIGLGTYLADSVGDNINAAYLPLMAFLLAGIVAFSTGTSFGTFSLMIPVTMGITAASPEAATWYGPVLAATLGGAVFGDHCSPISDTTVMSSMAGHCDHIDHVRTQLPYALTVAGIASAAYLILAFTGSLTFAWIITIVLLAAVTTVGSVFGARADRREAEVRSA